MARPENQKIGRLGTGLLGVAIGASAVRAVSLFTSDKPVGRDRVRIVGNMTPSSLSGQDASQTPEANINSEKQDSSDWPHTAEEAAERWGGDASRWRMDIRVLHDGQDIGIDSYQMIEWRYGKRKGEKPPFEWPKTAKEAVEFFGLGGKVSEKKMMPAWIDEKTGLPTGWHFTEDDHGDLGITVPNDVVIEGYSAGESLNPKDDRSFLVMGKAEDLINFVEVPMMQGFTAWMPGTDPNSVALRMSVFKGGDDHPHYRGADGKQLGPDAFGFTPVYRVANKQK